MMHYRLDRQYCVKLLSILIIFLCCMVILMLLDQGTTGVDRLEQHKVARMRRPKKKTEPSYIPLEQYDKLLEVNGDVIGMIHIPGVKNNDPVLLGRDNYYYLTHNEKKEKTDRGAICADSSYQDTNIRTEFLRHTLIYGRNQKDGTMFHKLLSYKKKKFFQKHRYIEYDNLIKKGKWRVFSVYVIDGNEESIMRRFDNDAEYVDFLNKIKERSKFATKVELNKDDKILTLCTSSNESDNAKLIVHAVLEK